MKNGFIYQIANTAINSMKYINLVEFFKFIAIKLFSNNKSITSHIIFSRNSVDIFILLKWLFILILWKYKVDNLICTSIVWYLIFSNLYTYFYYHAWSKKVLTDDKFFDIDRCKRRFLHLIIAMIYSIFSFSFLINIPYRTDFYWESNNFSKLNSFWFSLSNSLTANYKGVESITNIGSTISMIELIIMFLFITIIISNSIPQINIKSKKEN